MVHFITLYSFLIRKKSNEYEKWLSICNWTQGIFYFDYLSLEFIYYVNDKIYKSICLTYDWRIFEKKYFTKNLLIRYIWDRNNIINISKFLCSKFYMKMHGSCCYWHNNGKIFRIVQNKKGKIHGWNWEWYQNGKIHLMEKYINNKFQYTLHIS